MFVKTKSAVPYDFVIIGLRDQIQVRPFMQDGSEPIHQPWHGTQLELQIGKPMILRKDGEKILETGEVIEIYS